MKEISIYPNPFSSSTTLHFDNLLDDANISVYNYNGQMVKQLENVSGQTAVLLRDDLTSGVYYVFINQNNSTLAIEKIVIID